MIDTREELVSALSEAAELEHGLLIQYLFAALSMKRRTDEGITPVQQALLVDWERTILAVAHEEMYHLASVCNLLSAVGGAPQFGRPNFPQPMKSFYPFDFQLERFGDPALYRFVVFELPKGEPAPIPPGKPLRFDPKADSSTDLATAAPDPLVYNHVGELYRQIADGFKAVPEKELFIGPKPLQDTEDWGLRLKLRVVKDLKSALEAIDGIVAEGEGAPAARENSHYDRFVKMRLALYDERKRDPKFEPARPVVLNPQTRPHRDAKGPGTPIEHPVTKEAAEFFNDLYATMLLMLLQYYSYGGETRLQRAALRDASRRLMSAAVRPAAEVLTELPVKTDPKAGTAGPGFELYSGLRLSPDRGNRWVVLRERLAQGVKDATALARETKTHPAVARLAKVGEALDGTLRNLAPEFEGDA